MSEHRRRLERALRGCAERRTPDTVDLWPAIRERVSETAAGQEAGTSGTQASEDRVADGPRRRLLVPDRPLGWALAALSVLILGAGAYGASGPLREVFRDGLPGSVGTGSDMDAGRNPGAQTGDDPSAWRTEVDQTKTAGGAKVTLDWAYADEKFVVVGLEVQDLDGAQKSEEFESGFDPVVLQPSFYDDTVGNESELPPYVRITDASGQDFDTVGGGTLGPRRAEAVFDAPEGLEPGRGHRFRLEVPLQEGGGISGMPGDKPDAGPFVFDFEIPVRPAPAIELNQRVEAKGITLTLERVVNSFAQPQAVVCFRPPDDEHSWEPWLRYDGGSEKETASAPQKLEGGCWSLPMVDAVEGHSSVTVAGLTGTLKNPSNARELTEAPKTIRGPWTFEFEVPGE